MISVIRIGSFLVLLSAIFASAPYARAEPGFVGMQVQGVGERAAAAFKKKITGRDWDFDFRQIYFTYTPDITKTDFSPILTVASRDETAGLLRNQDMWVGPDGDAHLVYTDQNIWHTFMRDQFFPDMLITISLRYCRVHEGKVIKRRTLVEYIEDSGNQTDSQGHGLLPTSAAFHATEAGNPYLLYHVTCKDSSGAEAAGNYVLSLLPQTDAGPAKLNLKHPFSSFFTASERLGTAPSCTIDLYGPGPEPNTMRYAQIEIC